MLTFWIKISIVSTYYSKCDKIEVTGVYSMRLLDQNEMEKAFTKEEIEHLYHELKEQLYRYTLSRVGHRQVAEDIISSTFVRFIAYISKKNEGQHHYRGLLYTIAKGEINDHYRATKKDSLIDIEEIDIIDEVTEDPRESVDLQLSLEVVHGVMEQLPEYYKELIRLRHIAQLEYSEMAVIMGKKEGAIRMGLHRAIKMAQDLVR